MVEPVIVIGVGFFIIMCMMVKFTGINKIPDITDNTYDDIQTISKQDNIHKLVQDFDNIYNVNCINVNIDKDIPKYDLTYNNDEPSDDDIQQLMLLIDPIEDNIKQVSENNSNIFPETFHILDLRATHEKEIDLSDVTLISLKSIKQQQ